MLLRVISSGQTGADLAGLIAADELGLMTGGEAPRGYMTEEGPQPDSLRDYFGLNESEGEHYSVRIRNNILRANAALVVASVRERGEVRVMERFCQEAGKPYLVINPFTENAQEQVRGWLCRIYPSTLLVSGNYESAAPGICDRTKEILRRAFRSALMER